MSGVSTRRKGASWRIGLYPDPDPQREYGNGLLSTMNPGKDAKCCVHVVTAVLGSEAVARAKQEHRKGECPKYLRAQLRGTPL